MRRKTLTTLPGSATGSPVDQRHGITRHRRPPLFDLANDVAADGITVNAVLPALTNTPLVRDMPEEMKRQTWGQQAIKRFAEPEDIAGPVCFLTSDDAAFVTGQSIVVDGGQYKIS